MRVPGGPRVANILNSYKSGKPTRAFYLQAIAEVANPNSITLQTVGPMGNCIYYGFEPRGLRQHQYAIKTTAWCQSFNAQPVIEQILRLLDEVRNCPVERDVFN